MDRFQLMEIFAKVSELESFSKTAESLGISRAAVSMSVQQLEAHLGVRLLHRTTRRVHLTVEGLRFREHCLRILSELNEAEHLFRDGSKGVKGTLSVDVPTRIARRILLPSLGEFLARNPDLEIHLGASDRLVNLVEKRVDAVIRVGTLRDSSLFVRRLGVLTQINCASPHYLARHGRPTSLADLERHLLVNYAPSASHAATWDYVQDGEPRSRRMRSVVSVDNAETYIASALAGLGLIQIPLYDVLHHLKSGALVPVLPHFHAPELPVSLLYASKHQLPARLVAFAAWAAELFERSGLFAKDVPKRAPVRRARAPRRKAT